MLLKQSIQNKLTTKRIGQPLILLEEIDSTNRYVKQLASEGGSEGTVVIANRQSAGKGRMGRNFFSPAESGIYMSVLLRPQIELEKSTLITSVAAVAVARAIESVSGVTAQIKWVNDVFLHGKKTCGILTEAGINSNNDTLEYAVLGIGVNVGKMVFPEELDTIATSVSNESGVEIEREELISAILNELEPLYEAMHTGAFLKESRERSILLGKEIKVLNGNNSYSARALEIDDMGQLVVEANGKKQTLVCGEVSIRLGGMN